MSTDQIEKCFINCLYFSMGRLYRHLDRIAVESFKDIHIAPTHAFLIMSLFESKNHTLKPSELSKIMELDPSTITRLISTLESKKIVKRIRDGRKNEIVLTPVGIKLIKPIRKSWERLFNEYSKHFGEKPTKNLSKLISNIQLGENNA